MRCLWSGGTRSHSRMMSGPWLAANAPTRLAMVQAPDEFVVLHADGEEVVAQEIRIGARREERHVVLGDGALHALIERIAREDSFARRAELGRRRGRLQVEEELAQPIVAHEIGDRYVIILSALCAFNLSGQLLTCPRFQAQRNACSALPIRSLSRFDTPHWSVRPGGHFQSS